MKAIVCVSQNWGIGYKNQLLFHIPEDMKFFRQQTEHQTIVIGRKTYESIGHALPHRTNFVLTKNIALKQHIQDAHVISDIQDIHTNTEIYIIGGTSIYKQYLPFCDTIYVTKIWQITQADAFFPNLDQNPEWKITKQSKIKTYNKIQYQFLTYNKI